MIFFRVSSLVVLMLAVNAIQAKDLVRVQENAGDVSTRKAMLILPGLGGSNKRSAGIAEAMNYEGYDLFIPDYKDRKSVAESVDKLAEFIRQWQLELYDEVHVY